MRPRGRQSVLRCAMSETITTLCFLLPPAATALSDACSLAHRRAWMSMAQATVHDRLLNIFCYILAIAVAMNGAWKRQCTECNNTQTRIEVD